MRVTIFWGTLLLAATCASAAAPTTLPGVPLPAADAPEEFFPPRVFWPPPSMWPNGAKPEKIGQAKADSYASALKEMNEPPLYSSKLNGRTVYRMFTSPAWGPRTLVRIERAEDGRYLLTVKAIPYFSDPGPQPCNSKPIDVKYWNDIVQSLERADFWEAPTPTGMGFDGASFLFEAVKDGQYHVVDRWSPPTGSPFDRASMRFLRVANLHSQPPSARPTLGLPLPAPDHFGYFPADVFGSEPSPRKLAETIVKSLDTMSEPPLYSAKMKDVEVYRYTTLFPGRGARCLRVERDSSGQARIVARSFSGKRDSSKPRDEMRFIDAQAWQDVTEAVADFQFWQEPTVKPGAPAEEFNHAILEGVKDGRYHVVDRWSSQDRLFREVIAQMARSRYVNQPPAPVPTQR